MVSQTFKIAGLAAVLIVGITFFPGFEGPTERTRANFGIKRTLSEANGIVETNYSWMIGNRRATEEEITKYNLSTNKAEMWEFYNSIRDSSGR